MVDIYSYYSVSRVLQRFKDVHPEKYDILGFCNEFSEIPREFYNEYRKLKAIAIDAKRFVTFVDKKLHVVSYFSNSVFLYIL